MTTPNDKSATTISRRALLGSAAAACAATIAAPFINRGRYQLFAWSATEYSARTIALVQRSIVIDMPPPPSSRSMAKDGPIVVCRRIARFDALCVTGLCPQLSFFRYS